MLLKSITLKNIRGYVNETITFPDGSVLFSGDIGSGKSSILLAIEFALFGIIKTDLTGSALLRNGKNEGFVELNFEVDGKNVIIGRNLKRAKKQISQESGEIIINGVRTLGTANELKQAVLDLLGYPKELLTKSKSLIFKYTVYTPQDKIKEILFGDEEARLEILRKVFGIEKYKRIRENAQILTKELRENSLIFESQIGDLDDKKSQKKELADVMKRIVLGINENEAKIKAKKQVLKEAKNNFDSCEKDMDKLRKLKQELAVLGAKLVEKIDARSRNKSEGDELEENIINIKKDMQRYETEKEKVKELEQMVEVKRQELVSLKKDVQEKTKLKSDFENVKKKINELQLKIARGKAHIETSLKTISRIVEINNCPTCLQEVNNEHKKDIKARETEIINKINVELKLFSTESDENSRTMRELELDIRKIEQKENKMQILEIDIRNINEKIEDKKEGGADLLKILKNLEKKKIELADRQENLKKEVGEINKRKLELDNEILEFGDLDKKVIRFRTGLEASVKSLQLIEVERATLEKEKENIDDAIKKLDRDIAIREGLKKKLAKVNQLQNWVKDYFVKLMVIIEKNIMAQVYRDFNDIFVQWFNMLIEEEVLSAKLNDEFTPILEQNGHDISPDNLSGGEKTALSLAYRLALNKVINDFVDEIKTKDLIILDEPTDGFSTEQLDKVRDVIDELNVRQVIIVSHEAKIESFVENVIGIEKEGHNSKILIQ